MKEEVKTKKIKVELYNDHFENAKRYGIQHAQLIIADIPYNLGSNAYASNPQWYIDGDNKNGESNLAGKSFFDTDNDFKINNFFDFCTRYLNKEPKNGGERGKSSNAPAMIIFCAFEQIPMVIEQGKKHGLMKSYPLVFIKNFSAQVLKANMKIVNACEYAVVLYRDKLPKFRNIGDDGKGHMIFNWFDWEKDGVDIPKIHPTQKPVKVLKRLIEIFTEPFIKILQNNLKDYTEYEEYTKIFNEMLKDILEILGDKEIEEIPLFEGTLEQLNNLSILGDKENE